MHQAINVVADVFTIGASGIAIYLFMFQGKRIATIFRVLTSYAWQGTLSDLKNYIDRLGDLNVGNPEDVDEAISLLSEIGGQIRGNRRLRSLWRDLLPQLNRHIDEAGFLTEPRRRSLVALLRERFRSLSIEQQENLEEF